MTQINTTAILSVILVQSPECIVEISTFNEGIVMHEDPSNGNKASVVLVDEFDLRREFVGCFLSDWATEAHEHLETVKDFEQLTLDLLEHCRLLILNVGCWHCYEAGVSQSIAALRTTAPDVPIAVLTDSSEPRDVVASMQAGANGYIPSSTKPQVALHALQFILAGGHYFPPAALLAPTPTGAAELDPHRGAATEGLTVRQTEVLRLLREGKPNKVIARELNMQEATVKVHVRQIIRRLGVSNRTQAALAGAAQLASCDRHAPDFGNNGMAVSDATLAGERLTPPIEMPEPIVPDAGASPAH